MTDCSFCYGTGFYEQNCVRCDGTGLELISKDKCLDCGGIGVIDIPCPNCDGKGYINEEREEEDDWEEIQNEKYI